MNSERRLRSALRVLAAYAGAAVVCLLILAWVMRLWQADLRVPFAYSGGDEMLYLTWIKGMMENGWYLHNPSVGVPAGLRMEDFPMADNLHFLALKLLTLRVHDCAAVYNLFILLTYPLITLSALFVIRRFRVGYAPALVASLLFTFLPYHWLRARGHLFLCSYYLVPPAAWLILRLYQGQDPLFGPGSRCKKGTGPLNSRGPVPFLQRFRSRWKALGVLALCLLIGSAGVYYAFFACFFLLIAGISACCQQKRARPLGSAGVLIGVVFASVVLNLTPSLLYLYRHGPSPEGVIRHPAEAEIFGLKIAQLLLPTTGHRLPWLAAWKEEYSSPLLRPLVNENDTANLGIVAGAGFLLLLARLLNPRRLLAAGRTALPSRPDGSPEPSNPVWEGLTILVLAAVLLGTVGGFGALFALAGGSSIRAYNRISIYIAFFCLLAVALLLEQLARRWAGSTRGRVVYLGGLALLLAVGILDQTTAGTKFGRYPPAPHWTAPALKEAYQGDRAFVQAIEATTGPHALIFQLPYVGFPETAPPHRMGGYMPLRGYVHSKTLRWSYGGMKGREGDLWCRQVAALPVTEMVDALCYAGFGGVYVDRAGYADNAAGLESGLNQTLGIGQAESRNRQLAFYSLASRAAVLRSGCTAAAWALRQEQALHPVELRWGEGFGGEEPHPDGAFRWCAARGQLSVRNPLPHARRVELRLRLAGWHEQPARLRLDGLLTEERALDRRGFQLVREVELPPGDSVLEFACDAPRVEAPGETRELVFRVFACSVRDVAGGGLHLAASP